MSPIYPITIPSNLINNSSWTTSNEYTDLVAHIKNLCSNYPSLIMACSADFDASVHARFIAETITEWGINVFMPDFPVPLAALSYAITTKSMPIGLYIEEVKDDSAIRIIPISSHGGLFDNQDLNTSSVTLNTKKGVIGSTDIGGMYVKHLAGFADPFIEKGLSFSSFNNPFKELSKIIENTENLKILFEKDPNGPVASLNDNGCFLSIKKNGEEISTEEIAKKIAKYLKEERFTSGTIFVPQGKQNAFSQFGEVEEIEGNSYDLTYAMAFSDLFIGWSEDGLIAMQGSSCFGDGLLAAIYYLESLRTI